MIFGVFRSIDDGSEDPVHLSQCMNFKVHRRFIQVIKIRLVTGIEFQEGLANTEWLWERVLRSTKRTAVPLLLSPP